MIGKLAKLCFVVLVTLFGSAGIASPLQQPSIIIYGDISNDIMVDTVKIEFWDKVLPGTTPPHPKEFLVPTLPPALFAGTPYSSSFYLEIPVMHGSGYLTIYARKRKDGMLLPSLKMFLVEAGDSVKIRFDYMNAAVLFAGPAADKFRVQQDLAMYQSSENFADGPVMFISASSAQNIRKTPKYLEALSRKDSIPTLIRLVEGTEGVLHYTRMELQKDLYATSAWKALQSWSGKVSENLLNILKANYLGANRTNILKTFVRYMAQSPEEFKKIYKDFDILIPDTEFTENEIILAPYYLDFVYQKAKIAAYMEKHQTINYIAGKYNGQLRDMLLAKLVLEYFRKVENGTALLTSALAIAETEWIIEILQDFYNKQATGQMAYNFSLPDDKGNTVKLSDLKGKIVLIDFWFTGCGACISFYKRIIQPAESYFKNNTNFQIVTISIDKDKQTWLKSLAANEYTSDDAINLYTEGQGHKHDLIRHYNIPGYPHHILIDKTGKIYKAGKLKLSSHKDFIQMIEKAMNE